MQSLCQSVNLSARADKMSHARTGPGSNNTFHDSVVHWRPYRKGHARCFSENVPSMCVRGVSTWLDRLFFVNGEKKIAECFAIGDKLLISHREHEPGSWPSGDCRRCQDGCITID